MEINFLSLIIAALVPMVMGFIWYHEKVFGNAWMNGLGMTKEQLSGGNMAMIFGVSFLFALLLAFGMTVYTTHDNFIMGATYYETMGKMNPDPNSDTGKWVQYYMDHLAKSNHNFKHGAFHGMLIGGIFIALPMIVTNGLFERRSFKFIAINAGYWMITIALMGGIVASMS